MDSDKKKKSPAGREGTPAPEASVPIPRGNDEEEANSEQYDENDAYLVDEEFEVLEPELEDDTKPSVSSKASPVKLTPHKRTADAASGANGSPPTSPAPKKRKQWEDYLADDDKKKEKKEKEEKCEVNLKRIQWSVVWIAVVSGVVILLAVLAQMGYLSRGNVLSNSVKDKPRYTWKKISGSFVNLTKGLEKEFPKQNRETWIQLIASISGTMQKTDPVHPAAITVLYPPSVSKTFTNCFVQKVGNIVNKAVAPAYGSVPSPVKKLTSATFESSITIIRADLENYFKKKGKAVITFDIDQFKSEDNLMVFHGLCDNHHAVEKRATLLFPVQVPQQTFEKYDWVHARGGDIANDVLNDAWKTVLTPDSGPALVARVADSVILLNEGDDCKL